MNPAVSRPPSLWGQLPRQRFSAIHYMWMLTMESVTAAEANRQFSAVLREVAHGESVLVTSRGKPVATIVPARHATDRARERAKKRLFERLASIQPSGTVREWTRDELYD